EKTPVPRAVGGVLCELSAQSRSAPREDTHGLEPMGVLSRYMLRRCLRRVTYLRPALLVSLVGLPDDESCPAGLWRDHQSGKTCAVLYSGSGVAGRIPSALRDLVPRHRARLHTPRRPRSRHHAGARQPRWCQYLDGPTWLLRLLRGRR